MLGKNLLLKTTFLFSFILFSFIVSTSTHSQDKNITTIVQVIEGEVLCFDFPQDMAYTVRSGNIKIGIFNSRINEYTAKVKFSNKSRQCYIPQEFRYQIWDQLQPGIMVLTLENHRKVYQTEWDIISVGKSVTESQAYARGDIQTLDAEKSAELTEIADEIKHEMEAEEDQTTDDTLEEIINDTIDDTQDITPDEIEPIDGDQDDDGGGGDDDGGGDIQPVPDGGTDIVVEEDESIGEGDGPTIDEETAVIEEMTVPPPPEPSVTDEETATITAYYIDAVNGDDSRHGDTEADAWKTIYHAMSVARVSDVDIYLTGTFTYDTEASNPGNSIGMPIQITNRSNVRFRGQGSTTIDGDNASDATRPRDYQLFQFSGSTDIVFEDVDFVNGYATAEGGVMRLDASSVALDECEVSDSESTVSGGVAFLLNGSSLRIVDSTISNNIAASDAGAILAVDTGSISDSYIFRGTTYTNTSSTFSTNTATGGNGGAIISDGSIELNSGSFTFSNNSAAAGDGGAILGWSMDSFVLEGVTFTGNNSTDGGAIYLETCNTGSIQRCTFTSNVVSSAGGCITYIESNLAIVNSLFYNNTAQSVGALNLDNSSPNIYNCTFVNNSSTAAGAGGLGINLGAASPRMINCIIEHDTGLMVSVTTGGTPTIQYCDLFTLSGADIITLDGDDGHLDKIIDEGWDTGTCISSDPRFKTYGSNYRITNGDADFNGDASDTGDSPCVDTGFAIASVTEDIDGTTRPKGTAYDMGCYESVAGDPPITGRVYDSVTGATIASPVVAIYRKYESTPLTVTTNNPYTFNVAPGSYHIAVSKSGYGFPSQVISPITVGDHGEVFDAANDALSIDIPVDPGGWLYIEKTVNKKKATVGELITYNVKIQNKHWYQAVSDVELVDDIVNGFKYVSGSTYRGSIKLDDPVVSGRKAKFNIGTVAKNSSFNISYQVRVSTGIPDGRYKAAANTRNINSLVRNSNISPASVKIVEDPLFTRGTIVGKVFIDSNGNGIQDNEGSTIEEIGVSDVRIVTEYGVVVKTDDDGKFHIADVPAGNHLLKVDPSTLPEDSGFTTKNPLYVKVTEGLFVKANFGISRSNADQNAEMRGAEDEQNVSGIKKLLSKFFIVALGEGTVRNLSTSGNVSMVDKDDRYEDGLRVDGRLAFYLKGKVLGKYLITASVDTERLPNRKYDNKDLFTNLDPDKYYPVYGDASKVDYAGVDTQDVAYVLVEWDESFAKYGSFHTEIPLYNRTLSGGIVNYVSVKKTKFGDPYTIIKGFGAVGRQKASHDEFIGTGGSLYYLRNRDVIEGSEKIRVEVRDRVSKVTLSSVVLSEEKDYEIDYERGRILLKRPLNSIQQAYTSSIVSNDILMGERVYLLVDYEYTYDGLSDDNWGVRASQQIGDHVRIGGNYVQEHKYELSSGDVTLKINEDTSVDAFYGKTRETQLSSNISFDGGLNFSEQFDTFSDGKEGEGYSVSGRTKFFEKVNLFGSYSKYDPYFSASDSISQQGTEKYMATVSGKITDFITVGVNHVTTKILGEITPITTLNEKESNVTTLVADYRKEKWDVRGEYQHQEIKDSSTSFSYMGILPLVDNDFIAARVGYQLFNWLHPYLRGQMTLNGEANDQGTVGADFKIFDDTTLNIAQTVGTLGDSTAVGLRSTINTDTDLYANLEVGNHMRLGKYTQTTYGQSSMLNEYSRMYMEEDYSSYRENVVRGNVLGYENKITDTIAVGLTYERSNVERVNYVIDRDAGSISLAYLCTEDAPFNTEGVKGSSRVEIRNDRGTTEVRQWVSENDIIWRLTKGLNISGRANWGWTNDIDRDLDEAEFYEVGAGFSFRPTFWDKLNVLGKYSYLTDMPPDSQIDFIEDTDSRRHVYSIEGAYDIMKRIQLVGKFAYRDMDEKVGYRDWTESDTYLSIGRVNVHVLTDWDLACEYRSLVNDQGEDSKSGWLLEVDREIGQYTRIGVGYNFTDYDDDLSNDDDWDSEGWFLRVTGKY